MRFSTSSLLLAALLIGPPAHAIVVTAVPGSHTGVVDFANRYDYSPTGLQTGSGALTQTYYWWCLGATTDTGVYLGDTIFQLSGPGAWLRSQAILCPSVGGSNDYFPACLLDYSSGPDAGLVADPSVVFWQGEYWLYYTAPITGKTSNGVNNQIFLARSYDGVNWVKYPDAAHEPEPVIPLRALVNVYGIGESSVVIKDNTFYHYYTYIESSTVSKIRRAHSTDGIHFATDGSVFSNATIPFAGGNGVGGVEVAFLPGWKLWFMVSANRAKTNLVWNISRDGLHWLPYDDGRTLLSERTYVTSPGMLRSRLGWVGDSTLTTPQTVTLLYTTGPSMSDISTWKVDKEAVLLATQNAYGYLDGVDSSGRAWGWAYDPDTGTNDAASNGSPSAPLGLGTWVRATATNTVTGQYLEGPWQSSELPRCDLVSAGVAPDCYHGFSINLQGMFPVGTWRVRVQAGEFPTGSGATLIGGSIDVTLQ